MGKKKSQSLQEGASQVKPLTTLKKRLEFDYRDSPQLISWESPFFSPLTQQIKLVCNGDVKVIIKRAGCHLPDYS